MARALLAFGLVADGACLALLIGIAGFIFEGPEGARGDPSAVAIWFAGIATIIGSAIVALVFARRGATGRGTLIAWMPPLLGIAITFGLGELILPP